MNSSEPKEVKPVFSRQEGSYGQVALLAGLARVPVGLTRRAELQRADGTSDQLRQGGRVHLLQLADGLTGGRRAPCPARVQKNLWWNRRTKKSLDLVWINFIQN